MSAWNPAEIAGRCSVCDREFVEWMEYQHEIDLMAARDPETDTARADFAAWVEGGAA